MTRYLDKDQEIKESDECPKKDGEPHHVVRVCLDCHQSFE
jgi:hypothetical protein